MFKKLNKKGFTLAELLVVVAIIGVLVAISIPIFTAQLKKARLATNQANARAAYAMATAQYLAEDSSPEAPVSYEYTVSGATLGGQATGGTATITKAIDEWTETDTIGTDIVAGEKTADKWVVELSKDGALLGFTAE